MKKNNINSLQLSSFIVMIMVSGLLGSGLYSLIKSASIDGYISIILGFIIGLIILFMFLYIASYEINLSINQKINKIFGKYVGFFLNLILVISVFIIAVIFVYNFNNFMVSQFLSETPIWVLIVPFAILSFYIIINGVEVLSRISLLLLVLNLFLFLVEFLALAPSVDLNNFMPILKDGLSRPLTGVFHFVTTNVIPIFLFLMIPKNNIVDKNKYNKFIICSYVISSLLVLLFYIVTIGNLGIHLASSYLYPGYIVLKRISLFNFLDRIENIIVVQWIFGSYISIVFMIYYLSNTIKYNNKSKLLNIIIIILLAFTSTKAFYNNTLFNDFVYYIFPYVKLVILLVMIVVFIGVLIKKRKQKSYLE